MIVARRTRRANDFSRALMIVLICLLMGGCREQIVHNLTEGDGNRVISALTDAGIEAEKVRQPDGRWAISVPREATNRAIKRLNEARLLRESPASQEEKSSIMASREDQRFRFERALSGEIESTMGSVRGVLEARIHLNLPVTDPLFGQPLSPAAGSGSALLVVDDQFNLTKEEVAALVSGASGIPSSAIQVLVSQGEALNVAPIVGDTAATNNVGSDRILVGQLIALVLGSIFVLGSIIMLRSKRRRSLAALSLRLKDGLVAGASS